MSIQILNSFRNTERVINQFFKCVIGNKIRNNHIFIYSPVDRAILVREETGMSFGLEWWEKLRKSGGDHFVKELVVAMRG